MRVVESCCWGDVLKVQAQICYKAKRAVTCSQKIPCQLLFRTFSMLQCVGQRVVCPAHSIRNHNRRYSLTITASYTPSPARRKCIIIGAGIGGLALAGSVWL